jgi:hypothetical protein
MSKSEFSRSAFPRELPKQPNIIDGNLMDGEGTLSDRAFKLMKLQKLGVVDKGFDFLKLRADSNAFDVVERSALSDAQKTSRGKGFLMRHVRGSDPRLQEVWYEGDPTVWMDEFKSPGYRAKINTECGTHKETITLKDGERAVILRRDGTVAHPDGREVRQGSAAH